ncbi:MAG: sialate O-acetylesterase [Chitinophaga rupis]
MPSQNHHRIDTIHCTYRIHWVHHTVRILSLMLLVVCLCLAFSSSASAHVKLPAIFSDHMVLQQKAKVPVWGWADPGEKIMVTTGWSKMVYSAQADASGKWKVMVQTPAAGGPFIIDVAGTNSIHLQDILIGEVWLCSGQSHMVISLKSSEHAEKEIAQANFPAIRYFSVTRQYANRKFDDSPGAVWETTTSATAPSFSAVAYFFAKKLHQKLNVPIGLVYSAWGGTPAEAWTPEPVLKADTILARYIDRWRFIQENVGKDSVNYHIALANWEQAHHSQDSAASKKTDDRYTETATARTSDPGNKTVNPGARSAKKPEEPQTLYYYERPWREPGVLLAGMIDPIIPFAIKGVLWYQGESNVNYADEYFRLLSAMIHSWRARWGTEAHPLDFSFYVVQISAFGYSSLDNAARVRDAEYQVMKKVPNTGTAVTVDLGNMKNIHFTRKEEVGDRLARIALARDYGYNSLVYKGPEAQKANGENGKVLITFEPSTAGLSVNGLVRGFELGYRAPSGDSLLFVPAEARIEGNKIRVWNDQVKNPVEVRYAWLLVAEANLFNTAGLPAYPFRMKITGKKQ